MCVLLYLWLYIGKTENFGTRFECPTRNVSYDLRGEAYYPPRINFPFDNSVIGPSNENCYPRKDFLI